MQRREQSNAAATIAPHSDEDMDILRNGSMLDLELRMEDLDKVLEEISQIDVEDKTKRGTPRNSEKVFQNQNDKHQLSSTTQNTKDFNEIAFPFNQSFNSILSDEMVIDDFSVSGEGLAAMQAELLEAEVSHEQQAKQVNLSAVAAERGSHLIAVIVTKPTHETPLGISMKTSRGVTTIVGIQASGLLKGCGLCVGMELIEVNGVSIKNAIHARHLIQGASAQVKLVAVDHTHGTTTSLKVKE